MSIIKAARTYRLDLPAAGVLAEHLAERAHREITESEFSTAGFVAPFGGSELVVPVAGGYVFSVRYCEKILPASVVNAEVEKRVKAYEERDSRKIYRKEKQQIRDDVSATLVRRALTRSTVINCLYHVEHRTLIVAVGSKNLAAVATNQLLQAVGSIKAQTIYAAEQAHGITNRLRNYLDETTDTPFDTFQVGGQCKLKGIDGERWSIKHDDLYFAKDAISEAFANSAVVQEIELYTDSVRFRLAHDFGIAGVKFEDLEDADDFEDSYSLCRHEAGVRLLQFSAVVNRLCEMVGYKEPQGIEQAPLV